MHDWGFLHRDQHESGGKPKASPVTISMEYCTCVEPCAIIPGRAGRANDDMDVDRTSPVKTK